MCSWPFRWGGCFGIDSGYSFLRSHPQGPLEDGPPEVSPTVYEGISFFLGVWGSLGYLPRVCGQNHGSFLEDHFAQLCWTVWTRLVSDLYNTMVGTVNLECPVDLIFGSQNHLPFGKTNMAIEYPHVQWYIVYTVILYIFKRSLIHSYVGIKRRLFKKEHHHCGFIYAGLGFFATVIGVFSYGGDISDCNGGFLQRC